VIARIWRGAVREQDGDANAGYMRKTGIGEYASTPGNCGAWMLRRDLGEKIDFLIFTLWDSLHAVKATRAAYGHPDVRRAARAGRADCAR
jgi:heme-degrading monooxygenase HmoA